MTKRNPTPPGAENKHYTYERCDCGRPYITNIPPLPRPTREHEPDEPGYNVPAAIFRIGASENSLLHPLLMTIALIAIAFIFSVIIYLLGFRAPNLCY